MPAETALANAAVERSERAAAAARAPSPSPPSEAEEAQRAALQAAAAVAVTAAAELLEPAEGLEGGEEGQEMASACAAAAGEEETALEGAQALQQEMREEVEEAAAAAAGTRGVVLTPEGEVAMSPTAHSNSAGELGRGGGEGRRPRYCAQVSCGAVVCRRRWRSVWRRRRARLGAQGKRLARCVRGGDVSWWRVGVPATAAWPPSHTVQCPPAAPPRCPVTPLT